MSSIFFCGMCTNYYVRIQNQVVIRSFIPNFQKNNDHYQLVVSTENSKKKKDKNEKKLLLNGITLLLISQSFFVKFSGMYVNGTISAYSFRAISLYRHII